jgi:membrane fusion protein, multidrug efflux system
VFEIPNSIFGFANSHQMGQSYCSVSSSSATRLRPASHSSGEGKLGMTEGVRRLLVCAFAFVGSGSWAAEPGDAAHQSGCGSRCSLVRVAVVGTQYYARKVTLTGSVEPTYSSNVAFRISGKIEQRFVEVGDHITADKVLARIDPQVQQAALDSAKAALVSAKALLTQAMTTFERQTELIKSGYTTRRTYDQAEQQLRTEEAAVDSAQAAVSTAEEQLGYAELKAGIAGIVTARNAETGEVVQAGQTVFKVAHDGPRDAVFDVYEALLNNPPSRRVEIYLQSDPSVATTGQVREISPTVDPSSGTVKVKMVMDRVPPQMSLGSIVVGVGTFPPREAIILPRSALFRWHDAPAVWLFDPRTRTVTPKVIKIDHYSDEDLVLSEGLSPGDTIVTAGVQFLYPGQVVEVAADGSGR